MIGAPPVLPDHKEIKAAAFFFYPNIQMSVLAPRGLGIWQLLITYSDLRGNWRN